MTTSATGPGRVRPASMKVLGDWNWYLPAWLEWLPRIGSEAVVPPERPAEPEVAVGEPTLDEPEPEPAPVSG